MNKLDAVDSGSNYRFGDKLQQASPPRSVFDLSHLSTTTIDNAGALIPISLFEVLPNDDIDLSVSSLIRVMPQVVPLYSRQRLYVHGFYSRASDLWSGFNTFMSRGRDGRFLGKVPAISKDMLGYTNSETVVAGSLADFLGLPQGVKYADLATAGVSVLPFVMYQRIWRDYFCNANFYNTDTSLFPADDSRYRVLDSGIFESGVPTLKLKELLYRCYPDDYFTSALPFPQRGDTPSLSFALTQFLPISTEDGVFKSVGYAVTAESADPIKQFLTFSPHSSVTGDFNMIGVSTGSPSVVDSGIKVFGDAVSQRLGVPSGNLPITVTLDQLRQLAIAQSELEKMARTDGSYSDFGLTFFGVRPKNAQDFKPLYIGGSYQSISFTEVLQTSASSGSSALGQYAGHGISADSSRIGSFRADDYGYVMIVASLMPDVYYSQGLDKLWTRSLQSQFYLPERARLGMQPILNKELYFSGVTGQDDDLFAYQSAFDDYRYKASRISGKIADKNALSFFPYTQSRKFSFVPTFSKEFIEARDVRKDYLFAPNEVAYSAQFSIGVRAVRPLPYQAVPAQII